MNLCDLMARYGTDKNTGHSYGPVYDQLLAPVRGKTRRVLEIGIDRGESLKVWRDYFPDAWVHGLDKNPVDLAEPRIVCHQGDQADPAVLDQIGSVYGPFDLIVDDGSHRFEDQFWSLLYLWRHMADDGLYVIEDVQDPEPLIRLLPAEVRDLRGQKGIYDDVLVILRKE